MFTVYLVFLVFGGTLLLFSLFGGADSDADFDFSGDADVDMLTDGDFENPLDGEGLTAAAQYFTFRNLVFFSAFFGLTGVVLYYVNVPEPIAFCASSVMGLFTAIVGHKVMAFLKDSESGSVFSLKDIEGLQARVVLAVAKDNKGKVEVTARENAHVLLAVVAEESREKSFNPGDTVTVVRVREGVAEVAREDFIG